MNAQLSLLKVAVLYFDKLAILDPVGASLATIGADHHARDAVKQLQEAGILQTVTRRMSWRRTNRGQSDTGRDLSHYRHHTEQEHYSAAQ